MTVRPILGLLFVVVVEVLTWELGRYSTTESFAWFRVAAHLGTRGGLLALAAGGTLAALAARFGGGG